MAGNGARHAAHSELVTWRNSSRSRVEAGRATEVYQRWLCAFPPVAGTHILADAGYLTPMPHLPNEYPDEPEPCRDDGHDDVAEKAKEAVSLGHGRAFRFVGILVLPSLLASRLRLRCITL